jgi:hypothetical protein
MHETPIGGRFSNPGYDRHVMMPVIGGVAGSRSLKRFAFRLRDVRLRRSLRAHPTTMTVDCSIDPQAQLRRILLGRHAHHRFAKARIIEVRSLSPTRSRYAIQRPICHRGGTDSIVDRIYLPHSLQARGSQRRVTIFAPRSLLNCRKAILDLC